MPRGRDLGGMQPFKQPFKSVHLLKAWSKDESMRAKETLTTIAALLASSNAASKSLLWGRFGAVVLLRWGVVALAVMLFLHSTVPWSSTVNVENYRQALRAHIERYIVRGSYPNHHTWLVKKCQASILSTLKQSHLAGEKRTGFCICVYVCIHDNGDCYNIWTHVIQPENALKRIVSQQAIIYPLWPHRLETSSMQHCRNDVWCQKWMKI